MPAADAKGIRIHKVLDSLAGPVTGDFARLQQVVWNLLSNAVKFTPKGGQVQVLLERVNSHVEISVIDTGIGIQPEFLPARLRPLPPGRRRARRGGTAGLGLGLAIVKHLVEMHGGTVRAKSPGEGQGATFTVTLPITVVHPEQPGPGRCGPRSPPPTEESVRTVPWPASRCSWSMTSPTPGSSSAACSPIATPRWPSPPPPPRRWNSSSGSAPT